jgi:hypothetical protein
MTKIPDNEIFGGRIADGLHDYALAYEAGKAAGAAIAVGKQFRGGFGYADLYAGSTKACRESAAWKGAMNGYMDGLPKHRAIVVDDRGFIVSLDQETNVVSLINWLESNQ